MFILCNENSVVIRTMPRDQHVVLITQLKSYYNTLFEKNIVMANLVF